MCRVQEAAGAPDKTPNLPAFPDVLEFLQRAIDLLSSATESPAVFRIDPLPRANMRCRFVAVCAINPAVTAVCIDGNSAIT